MDVCDMTGKTGAATLAAACVVALAALSLRAQGPASVAAETAAFQREIDRLAAEGGGTLTVTAGEHRVGALFFRPGVNLELAEGAVLAGSDDPADYPLRETRIEGETRRYYPALVNADGCDGFRISGRGVVDGRGQATWRAFWAGHRADRNFTNTDPSLLRPRVLYVSNSRNVEVSGATFRNSCFWTTHFYRCEGVDIHDCAMLAEPDGDVRAPSSDGIDIDNCRDVRIRRVTIAVNDDAIAVKGGKGPWADDAVRHPENGPSSGILVEECLFRSPCHSCLTLGSECPAASNVVMRGCRVDGAGRLLWLKMRTDTPQRYSDVLVENCSGTCGMMLDAGAWRQYEVTGGRPAAELMSRCSRVTMRGNVLTCTRQGVRIRRDDEVFSLAGLDIGGNTLLSE